MVRSAAGIRCAVYRLGQIPSIQSIPWRSEYHGQTYYFLFFGSPVKQEIDKDPSVISRREKDTGARPSIRLQTCRPTLPGAGEHGCT